MTAKKSKKPTKKKEIECLHCGTLFTPERSTAKFCSDSCRQVANKNGKPTRKSRRTIDEKIDRLVNTGFIGFISSHCKRAGTIEILKNVDFVELYDLFACKGRWQFNMEDQGKLNISHYIPVAGAGGQIGTLHPHNLGIWPESINKSFQNQSLPFGISIPVSTLDPNLSCSSTGEAWTKIKQTFKSELGQLLSERSPTETSRYTQVKWAMKHGSTLSESKLQKMDKDEFKAHIEHLGYQPPTYRGNGSTSIMGVLHSELERQHRLYPNLGLGETIEILTFLRNATQWASHTLNLTCKDWSHAAKLVEQGYRAAILHQHKELALTTISLCDTLERYSDNPVPDVPAKLSEYVNQLPLANLREHNNVPTYSFDDSFELDEIECPF